MAALLVLLSAIVALWWLLPPRPRISWEAGPCRSMHVSPDGQTLVTEHELQITLWELFTGKQRGALDRTQVRGLLAALPAGEGPAPMLGDSPSFGLWPTPDGNGVVFHETQVGQTAVVLWPGGGHAPRVIPRAVDVAAFTPDGQAVIAQTAHGLSFVSLATGQVLRRPPKDAREFHAQAIPGGSVLTVETDEKTLAVRDLATQAMRGSVPAPREPYQVALSGDGNVMAVADASSVQVWELPAGKRRCAVTYPSQEIVRDLVELNAEGTRMLLRVRGNVLRPVDQAPAIEVWEVTSQAAWKLRRLPESAAAATATTFSSDGRWVLQQDSWTGDEPLGAAILWDAATMGTKYQMSSGGWCGVIHVDPSCRTVAAHWMTEDQPSPRWVDQWLPGGSRPALSPGGFSEPLHCVRVWKLADNGEVALVPDASAFAYLPDGSALVTWRSIRSGQSAAGANGPEIGIVEIWDIPPRRPGLVEYGLPVLFALLLLIGLRLIVGVWRGFRGRERKNVSCQTS